MLLGWSDKNPYSVKQNYNKYPGPITKGTPEGVSTWRIQTKPVAVQAKGHQRVGRKIILTIRKEFSRYRIARGRLKESKLHPYQGKFLRKQGGCLPIIPNKIKKGKNIKRKHIDFNEQNKISTGSIVADGRTFNNVISSESLLKILVRLPKKKINKKICIV